MMSSWKCLVVFSFAVAVQASNNVKTVWRKNTSVNFNIRIERRELAHLNSQLKMKIVSLSDDDESCACLGVGLDEISKSLTKFETQPLPENFNEHSLMFKPIEDKVIKILSEKKELMSESLKSILRRLKSYIKLPENCAEAAKGKFGVFGIGIPESDLAAFPVYCEKDNWMVILRVVDDSVDFQRVWSDYKQGFGYIRSSFIMGLEKLHQITKSGCYELRVVLEDFDNHRMYANFDQFGIDDEEHGYALKTLGNYSGNAGNNLIYHKGMKFSTIDRDNDNKTDYNCAEHRYGGWWYNSCTASKLTGRYFSGGIADYEGIMWSDGKRPYYSYKFAKMMIRPKICYKK